MPNARKLRKYHRNLNYPLYTHSYAFGWERCVINGEERIFFNNKKTLVYDWIAIPDIHLRFHLLKKLLKSLPPTRQIIFLGDYFDGFHASQKKVIKMCNFIGKRIFNPKFEFIIGNHDAHYLINDETIRSSGYKSSYHKLIHRYLMRKYGVTVRDFKLAVYKEGTFSADSKFILSHAGLLQEHLTPFISIEENIERINQSLNNPFDNPFLVIGKSRGGKSKVPGLTWCDWNDEFYPVPGYSQVVGHTYAAEEADRIKYDYLSTNYNIDTGTTRAFCYSNTEGIKIIKL